MVPLVANRFLEMMAELAVAWLLLEGAVIARRQGQVGGGRASRRGFYAGKIAAAQYYARNVLPGVEEKARQLDAEDRTALDIPDAAFASV